MQLKEENRKVRDVIKNEKNKEQNWHDFKGSERGKENE